MPWLESLRAVPLPQWLVLLSVVMVPVVQVQMALLHYRGNFHRRAMYIPVVFPPFYVVAGFLLLGTGAPWAAWLFGATGVLLLLMGVLGFYFHLQGVSGQTGGMNLDNLMVGPPFIVPLVFSILALVGLLGLAYWS